VFLAFIATQLPAKEIEQLGELFKQVDRDNDGYLSVKEIEETLHEQGINPSYNELHYILKSMDMDKNGKINYN
jgi:Ca2+-binding EF-hand superfamily protein